MGESLEVLHIVIVQNNIYNVLMGSNTTRFIIDKQRLQAAINASGFRTVSGLARALGLHRNSISSYLNGGSVFPEALERIFIALNLDPANVIRSVVRPPSSEELKIANLVDEVSKKAADCCVVLYGSRARGHYKPFSDYDLGVFAESPMSFETFSAMLSLVDDWNESNMQVVQLTDLSSADFDFLAHIGPDLRFIGGSRVAWTELLKKAIEKNG
jgi:predicted nucleotidyltransferase